MIPSLRVPDSSIPLYVDFMAELRLRGFEGEVSATAADRTVFATDNSIYQVKPQAIAFPRNTGDVVRLAKLAGEPRFEKIVLTPRGGGTGTNGQSLTDGILVDLSRHMNRIVSINAEERWAWVEAGVVKDQLNDAIRQHGLFFAPELSPSNRATIGGMIATDACGQGSVLYGKTRDHVLELKCVFLDGATWHSVPLTNEQLERVKERPDRIGTVHRILDRIASVDAALIAERFPKLNRCVTGYDLPHLRDVNGCFDLNSILCGAEGTLAIVTEAKVNLVPIPKHSALVNIRYASFDAALRDARNLMEIEAASSETLDGTVLALARGDSIWLQVDKYFPTDPHGPTHGVNLVEFLAEDEQALADKLARVETLLSASQDESGRLGYTIAYDESAVLAIWSMRKRSVGLLGNMPGEKRPVPFVEDTVVPPENLADYIAEFRAVLDRRDLTYGMFGHVDAGCLHVRPALDMKDPAQEALVREISDEVFALTRKYKGVLWGEHGKGVRSEYAPEFFGPLYPRLQEIKAAFDPKDQLNPGKIAAPPGRPLLRVDGVATRGQVDRLIPLASREANQDSLHCNGNAACFNYDPDDAMCPSWKATRERRHSPKGRASLMREWLRSLGQTDVDLGREAQSVRRSGWVSLPRRLINSWSARNGSDDFSHAVKEAMDGCLACKSCVGQCPIKVDVPEFRSRFLELYHGRYARPPRERLVASLEQLLPWIARTPSLTNAITSSRMGRAAMEKLGLVALQPLDGFGAERILCERGVMRATPKALARIPNDVRRRTVVVVQDAFTSHYDAEVVVDFCELIRHLGFTPWLAPLKPNGKPQHVLGFLGAFERTARDNAAMLRALAATGVDLIGIDPSMTLTYRAEYVKAIGKDLAPTVWLPQEWFARHLDELPDFAVEANEQWALLPHCTERTNALASISDWQRVARRLGIDLRVLPSGCCGMAGLYGHTKANRPRSEIIYRLSWANYMADPHLAGRIVATGYSCRTQTAIIDGVQLLHPVQMLLGRLKAGQVTATANTRAATRRAHGEHHEEY